MIKIGCWNIRGLNDSCKQSEIRNFISKNNIQIFGILETRVRSVNKDWIQKKVFRDWSVIDNQDFSTLGRIWIGWNSNIIQVKKFYVSTQMVILTMEPLDNSQFFYASFVYGSNDEKDRKDLWRDICHYAPIIGNQPWILLGDFNVARHSSDIANYSRPKTRSMTQFVDAINSASLEDLKYVGVHYTWSNKQVGPANVSKKLDRVLINDTWLQYIPDAMAEFFSPGVSDHSPSVVTLGSPCKRKR